MFYFEDVAMMGISLLIGAIILTILLGWLNRLSFNKEVQKRYVVDATKTYVPKSAELASCLDEIHYWRRTGNPQHHFSCSRDEVEEQLRRAEKSGDSQSVIVVGEEMNDGTLHFQLIHINKKDGVWDFLDKELGISS